MGKIVNIICEMVKAPRLLYQGPEGNVWTSNKRNDNANNIHETLCCRPNPNDGVFMMEPIVTTPEHYDIDYLSKFKKVFGCFGKAFDNTKIKDKYVCTNYGYDIRIHSPMLSTDTISIKNRWQPWEQRNGMIIVAGGDKKSTHPASIYPLRLMIADLFYENNFEVAWYGQQNCNRPYYKGPIQDKVSEINKYKFTICTENTYDPIYSHNYLTEKLPHAIYGGALPLYIGCYNIDNLAPKHSFFDLRNFVIRDNGKIILLKQPLLEAINSFTKEKFERYQETAYQFVKDPAGLSYHTDMKRFFRQMLNEYYCP